MTETPRGDVDNGFWRGFSAGVAWSRESLVSPDAQEAAVCRIEDTLTRCHVRLAQIDEDIAPEAIDGITPVDIHYLVAEVLSGLGSP